MKTTYTENKTAVSFEWETFEEWQAEYKEWLKTNEGYRHHRAHAHTMGGSLGWYGHKDGFDGCLNAIENGWPEMRESLLKAMEGVELDLPHFPSLVMTRRRKRKWQDTGDDYDQQRTWNGDFEHAWCKPVRTENLQPNTKRVTLAFDVTDNASVSHHQALWRAALSLLLCDSLARAGRVFEVWCIDSIWKPFQSYNAPSTLWSGWRVKGSEEPVVLDRLAGMLGVGFLRTVGFMSEGMGPYVAKSGLGSAMHRGLPHGLQERRNAGEVVIRIAGCYSKADAIRCYTEAWREVEAATGHEPEGQEAA